MLSLYLTAISPQSGEKDKEAFNRAFEETVFVHEKLIYHLALSLVKNEEDAQDITQTVFLKAYRSYASFRKESKPETWLYTITRNTAFDLLRRQNGGFSVSLYGEDGLPIELPVSNPDPCVAVIQKEERKTLWQAIGLLPYAMREILVLRDMQEFSYALIGDMLQLEEGTVKSRLFRARKKLKEILTQGNDFAL